MLKYIFLFLSLSFGTLHAIEPGETNQAAFSPPVSLSPVSEAEVLSVTEPQQLFDESNGRMSILKRLILTNDSIGEGSANYVQSLIACNPVHVQQNVKCLHDYFFENQRQFINAYGEIYSFRTVMRFFALTNQLEKRTATSEECPSMTYYESLFIPYAEEVKEDLTSFRRNLPFFINLKNVYINDRHLLTPSAIAHCDSFFFFVGFCEQMSATHFPAA